METRFSGSLQISFHDFVTNDTHSTVKARVVHDIFYKDPLSVERDYIIGTISSGVGVELKLNEEWAL